MVAQNVPVDTSWTLAPAVFVTVVVYAYVYLRRWLTVRRTHGQRPAP